MAVRHMLLSPPPVLIWYQVDRPCKHWKFRIMLCVRYLCQQKDNAICRRIAHVIENEWRARMGVGTWRAQSNVAHDDRAERYLRGSWVPYYYYIRQGEGGQYAQEVMNRPSDSTFHFHVLPYSDAVVIQGYRIPRLVFRKWANKWYQVMTDDAPPMVRRLGCYGRATNASVRTR